MKKERYRLATKYIRFNYFEVVLVPYALIAMQEAEDEADAIDPLAGAVPYDMNGMLNYILGKQMTKLDVQVSDEVAEMEPGSLEHPVDHLMTFQLSKLKDTNIPAKKRIGEVKENIILRDDEYIGEFTSIIYDTQLSVMMVQSNKYGLNTRDLEVYLTELRWRYLSETARDEESPNVVRLRPIIEMNQAQKVLDAKYFRKITIKGADMMEDALVPDGLMNQAIKALAASNGVTFEITLSMHRSGKDASLDQDYITQIVTDFESLPESQKPKVEISKIDDDGMNIDVVNLLEPRMSDRIRVEIEPRKTIGHEYLFQQMYPAYESKRSQLFRILRPREN